MDRKRRLKFGGFACIVAAFAWNRIRYISIARLYSFGAVVDVTTYNPPFFLGLFGIVLFLVSAILKEQQP